VRHQRIGVPQGSQERRLALRQWQGPLGNGMNQQAGIRTQVMRHAVGLKNQIAAPPKPRPELVQSAP
jgi:hypothetical protein